MVGNALRALWAEPRPEGAPVRAWRDRGLVGALLIWSALEALLREDLAWRPVVLAAVVVAFGVLTAVDVARIFAGNEHGLLSLSLLPLWFSAQRDPFRRPTSLSRRGLSR